jgi:hypothetical protein
MKIHHIINVEELPYPIARNLTDGIPLIKKMLAILLRFVKKNYEGKKIVFFCRGSSGAIISSFGADYFMKKGYEVYINHIKKEGEKSHNGSMTIYGADLEGAITIIIDDFVASGETVKSIVDKTLKSFKHRLKDFRFDILCVTGILEKPNELMIDFEELPIDHALCE